MTYAEFMASERADTPPDGLSAALLALWWDGKGDWARAHAEAAADEDGREAAWVHAYLHRVEGDESNARYWYARAGRSSATAPLGEERDAIARALLGEGGAGT